MIGAIRLNYKYIIRSFCIHIINSFILFLPLYIVKILLILFTPKCFYSSPHHTEISFFYIIKHNGNYLI